MFSPQQFWDTNTSHRFGGTVAKPTAPGHDLHATVVFHTGAGQVLMLLQQAALTVTSDKAM